MKGCMMTPTTINLLILAPLVIYAFYMFLKLTNDTKKHTH